ncbi:glycosyltransferase family 1 protein [Sesbania bispinosa]|nr:glycosyltransferase family 1 protein [Sesbania bispinosa]
MQAWQSHHQLDCKLMAWERVGEGDPGQLKLDGDIPCDDGLRLFFDEEGVAWRLGGAKDRRL